MPSITITISANGDKWRADNIENARLVNGNSDYKLTLVFIGTGWESGQRKATVTATTLSGEMTITELTSSTNTITLPAMAEMYLLRVNVSRGGRETTTPALIFCDACATDNSGKADVPESDIYNMMTEYIHRKDIGDEDAAGVLLTRLKALRETAAPAFPGSAYRLAARRADRVTRITGTVTRNGAAQEITEDDILANSLSVVTDIMPRDTLLPGGAPSAEMRVELRIKSDDGLDGAEIALTYHILRHDAIWCDVPIGVFTVAEHTQTERGYAITAYDDMRKLEKIPRDAVLYKRYDANTVRELVRLIRDISGLTWDGVLPPYKYTLLAEPKFAVGKVASSVETAWDLLSWTMQAIGFVAYIDRNRVLRIKNLLRTESVAQYRQQEITRYDISKTVYRMSYLSTTCTFTDDVDRSSETSSFLIDTFHTDGVTAIMDENPMWNGVDNWDRIQPKRSLTEIHLPAMAEAIAQTTYKPGEISIHGDPAINLMEWITAETPAGTAEFPVTRSEWHYRGEHTLTAAGREAIAGVGKTLESKQRLSKEKQAEMLGQWQRRNETILLARTLGHKGLSGYTHDWLATFTHTNLGGVK